MENSSTLFCSLCQEDDITTQAVSRCLECDDWLCTDAKIIMGGPKLRGNTKTVAEYGTLPPFALKISNRCTQHSDRFERFCSFHGVPCCIQCVSETHKDCELSPLVDVLQNVKESAAVYHLEQDLNEIQKNLEVAKTHLFERITKVHDQKKLCLNEIKYVRTSVNKHLDNIERNILDELSQKEKDVKIKIESLACQIESKKRRVVNLQDSLLKTKQYATDLQIFLSIKEIENRTSEDVKYLEDLENGKIMEEISLRLVVSSTLESLQRDVVEFGTISVTSVPSSLQLTRIRTRQAQLSVPVVPILDKVNLVKILTIKFTGKQSRMITACAILPTVECIFADYGNDRLVLYNSEGRYVRNVVQTSGVASDMCYIKDNVVGISFVNNKIHFIDVTNNRIVKLIQMESSCYGIDCYDRNLFVRLADEDAVIIMDLDGTIEQRVNIPGESVTRIAFYKNYIYCTNGNTCEVLCYDMKGTMVWKHKNEALISTQSITIDKRSNIIYAAGLSSNNLLAISLDGNQSKIVLSEEDGLNKPRSVHVSTDYKLLVCNESSGLAFVYNMCKL